MQLRGTATLGEKTIRTYQNEHGMCILEIDGIYLIGWADDHANLVLPAELAATRTFETAATLCDKAARHIEAEMSAQPQIYADEQLDRELDEEQRLRGMCSAPSCDKPIAGWCAECPRPPKLCRGHLMAHCAAHRHWPFYSTPTGRN